MKSCKRKLLENGAGGGERTTLKILLGALSKENLLDLLGSEEKVKSNIEKRPDKSNHQQNNNNNNNNNN